MRCTLNRYRISRAHDDGAELGGRALRHLEGCAACSAFRDQTEQMGRSLSAARALAPRPHDREIAPSRLKLVAVGLALAATATLVVLGLSLSRQVILAELPATELPSTSAAPEVIAHEAAPIDVDALAGDASGGLRYVLRVSGLGQ